MGTSENLSFARSLRSSWRDDEEELAHESFEYAKRNISLIEYLASIANEGYELSITTNKNRYEGIVSFIGKNFFSLSHSAAPKSNVVTTFALHDDIDFVIRINKKQNRDKAQIKKTSIEDRSFKAFLDEICLNQDVCDLELNQGQLINGKLAVFKDFLRIRDSKSTKENFIEQDTTLFAISSIVAMSVVQN